MSSSNCCFLTCIKISQEAGQVVWYSHLFQNFPQFIVIHTVKGFGIVNKAEIDVFLELSCLFHDPVDVGCWETVETASDFIFLGSKITADGDCSHEIKSSLLLGRKAMTKLDSISKSRDINLLTKVHLVKAIIFPVVMYGCESCTIKKAECWRIDAFELWCWRRLLRVPWTARRSNQSILKEISPEYSLEGLMLKLKLQNTMATWCEELTHLKRLWCWERLKAGKQGDKLSELC